MTVYKWVQPYQSYIALYVLLDLLIIKQTYVLKRKLSITYIFWCADEAFVQRTRSDNSSCGCKPACKEVTYDAILSQRSYPSDVAAKLMGQDADYIRWKEILTRIMVHMYSNICRMESVPVWSRQTNYTHHTDHTDHTDVWPIINQGFVD